MSAWKYSSIQRETPTLFYPFFIIIIMSMVSLFLKLLPTSEKLTTMTSVVNKAWSYVSASSVITVSVTVLCNTSRGPVPSTPGLFPSPGDLHPCPSTASFLLPATATAAWKALPFHFRPSNSSLALQLKHSFLSGAFPQASAPLI